MILSLKTIAEIKNEWSYTTTSHTFAWRSEGQFIFRKGYTYEYICMFIYMTQEPRSARGCLLVQVSRLCTDTLRHPVGLV
jgi:hypothetical protein